jgi:uncharacterized protein involved in exopolysaccharide biosynthesis
MTPSTFSRNVSPDKRPPASAAISVFVSVVLITIIITTAVTFILPETFASTARIRLDPLATNRSSANFVQTEVEIIQSQLVLGKAIEKLNLNVEWGKKYFNGEILKTSESMQILKNRISFTPVRNTNIIAITAYSDDRQEAANVANELAQAYNHFSVERREAAQSSTNQLWIADPPSLLVDLATPAARPCKPNKPLNIALGAVFGIVMGAGAAAMLTIFRSRR